MGASAFCLFCPRAIFYVITCFAQPARNVHDKVPEVYAPYLSHCPLPYVPVCNILYIDISQDSNHLLQVDNSDVYLSVRLTVLTKECDSREGEWRFSGRFFGARRGPREKTQKMRSNRPDLIRRLTYQKLVFVLIVV